MKIRNLILLAFGLLPFFAAAQTATFDRVRVRQGLTIRSEKADSIIRAVTALSNHTSIPTAKAVWDAILATVIAAKYQTLRDNGTDKAQRAAANFVSTGTVAMALTDDAVNNETEIRATIPALGVTSAELAASSVNSSKIRDTTIVAGDIKNATITSAKLANSGVTAGNYPSTNSLVAIMSINAQGQVTAVSQVAAADISATNEGILGVSANGSNDAGLTSNTSTANTVVFAGGTGIAVTESTSTNGGTITISRVGGSSSDSTFALAPGGGYAGKRINSNVYRTGKVSLNTTDTTGQITIKRDSASNRPAIVANYYDASSVGFNFFSLNPVLQTGNGGGLLGNFSFWASNFPGVNAPYSSRANHAWRLGYNTSSGGGRVINTDADLHISFESMFHNTALDGVVRRVWEWHLQSQDTVGGVHRVISAQGAHNGKTGDIGFNSDGVYFSRYNSPSTNWLQVNRFSKVWAFRDSMSMYFDHNGLGGGGVWQRNAANSAYLNLLYADASDRVVNGSANVTAVYMPQGNLEMGANGNIYNANGELNFGKTGSLVFSKFFASNPQVIRLNSTSASRWVDFNLQGNEMSLTSNDGNAPFIWDMRAPYYSMNMNNAGSVNFGAYYFPSQFNIQSSGGQSTRLFSIINSTGENTFYRVSSTPLGAIAAAEGDIAIGSVGGIGRAWIKADGNGTTGNWDPISTGISPQTLKSGELVTLPMPTSINDCVYIGNVTLNGGGGSGNITLAINFEPAGVGIAKKYEIPALYAGNANVWQTLLPISSSGAYDGNDFEVEIRVNNNVDSLRIRRTAGSAATSAKCAIFLSAFNVADPITTYSKTWANAPAVTATYEQHAIAQVNNRVGINTAAPNTPLETVGTIRSTGTGTGTSSAMLELNNTTVSTGKNWYINSGNAGDLYIGNPTSADAITINGTTGAVAVGNTLTIPTATGTATTVTGRTSAGVITDVAIGSGLSLSGGTLSATGGGGGNYQTLRDDGTGMTQRAAANFVSTGTVAMALTDDAGNGETEIRATIPAGAVGDTELAATGVTAATYTNPTITIDVDGRITDAANGTPTVVTVPSLTDDADNLTASARVSVLRVSGDNGIRGITSISATGMPDGQTFRIVNIGTQPVVLQAQHPDATSGNEFLGPKDVFLPRGQSVTAVRDATADGFWVDGAQAQSGRMLTSTEVAGSSTAADWGTITQSANGGVFSNGVADGNGHYYWNVSTSLSATAAPTLSLGKGSPPIRFGDCYLYSRALLRLVALSDGTQTFVASAGLSSVTVATAAPANSVLIQYTHGTNSGKWYGYTSNAGSSTTVDLGLTVAAGTVYILEVYLNKQGTEARFFVNGIYRGRSTTTLPVAGTAAWPQVGIAKSVGTTSRSIYLSELSATYLYPN